MVIRPLDDPHMSGKNYILTTGCFGREPKGITTDNVGIQLSKRNHLLGISYCTTQFSRVFYFLKKNSLH